ncbi:MAG: VanW family protein, partial [Lentisphaeria bacterium]|nr:VanW family protein [Lentisphaeria bacterium]
DNRIRNIELALETLNGYCVEPGETFSFNGVIGQRTKEYPSCVSSIFWR